MVFDRFEGPLRNTLIRLNGNLDDFIEDVRTRHQGWQEQYAHYGKKPYYDRDKDDQQTHQQTQGSLRFAEPRQYNTNKAARFKSTDKYRPISGSARKALPAPDSSKVYHLRHDDSDSDPEIEDDDSRPGPNDTVRAYWVDNQAHVCNEKGNIWSSKAAEWGDTLSKAVKK